MSSPRATAGVLVLAVVAILGAVTGCDTGDGRTLSDPPPGATAPPLPAQASTTAAPAVAVNPPVGSNDAGTLVLGSPAFASGQPIPARYACDGDNVSPPLAWTGVPAGTVELALTVVDPDASDTGFVHWVVTRLSPALTGLEEDALPEGAVEAQNSSSEFGWYGPCPPAAETHNYVFTLYALTAPSGVGDAAGGADAIQAVTATAGVAATLTGTYTLSSG